MINGLEGIPGSGKSYEAVAYHILPALQAGRKVITNVPVDVERFAAIEPAYRELLEVRSRPMPRIGDWDPSDIANRPAFRLWADKLPEQAPEAIFPFGWVWDYRTDWRGPDGRGPLFVIDECHVSLPRDDTPDEVVQWFKLHRHYNADVLLMTQSFRDINQPIARLIGTLIRCRKADVLGDDKGYIRKVHAGYRGEVIQQGRRTYEPKFFALYKSHTQGKSVAETKAQDVTPFLVKFNRIKWAVLALSLVAIVWAFWPKPDTNIFGSKIVQPKQATSPAIVRTSTAATTPQAPASAASAPPPAPPKPKGPLDAKLVSLTGIMSSDRRQVAVFAVSENGKRMFDVTHHELERAGYKWTQLGYCFGWLEYEGERRPITCDAPVMATGAQDRPVTFDSGTGRSSQRRAEHVAVAGQHEGITAGDIAATTRARTGNNPYANTDAVSIFDRGDRQPVRPR